MDIDSSAGRWGSPGALAVPQVVAADGRQQQRRMPTVEAPRAKATADALAEST